LRDNRNTWEQGRGDSYGDISFMNLSFTPFKTENGNFGVGYKEHYYTIATTPSDNQQVVDVIDFPNDGKNNQGNYYLDFQLPYMLYSKSHLLQAQQHYKRYSISYTSTQTEHAYIPTGLGVSFAYEKGTKPYEGHDFIALKTEYDGFRYGIGINKDEKDLDAGFSMPKLGLYLFPYNHIIPYSLRTGKSNIDLGTVYEKGIESNFMYKFRSTSKSTYYIKFNLELASAVHNVVSDNDLLTKSKNAESIINGELYFGMEF